MNGLSWYARRGLITSLVVNEGLKLVSLAGVNKFVKDKIMADDILQRASYNTWRANI